MAANNNIELQIFGLVLRLNCPPDQQQNLLESAQRLEERVAALKEHSGIIQLEKVLAIIALNLNYELEKEQQKNQANKDVLISCIRQLDQSLGNLDNIDNALTFDSETAVENEQSAD